ncbi:MAG: hypothetical protein ACKV2U_12600 [Bryobacteraceae bacterium]
MSGCFGRAEAIGHAGERVEPFLTTLPVPAFRGVVRVKRAWTWRATPAWKTKSLRAAQLAWGFDGALEVAVESSIPVGRGCGSSTADCVAAVRAVADLPGIALRVEEEAQLMQRAELASGATTFDLEPVTFLPTTGSLLRRLGGLEVDRLACPVTAYSASELDEFAALLLVLEAAVADGDPGGVGRVARRSAAIHQRYRPDAEWKPLTARANAAGAFGVALAAVLSRKGDGHANSVGGRR